MKIFHRINEAGGFRSSPKSKENLLVHCQGLSNGLHAIPTVAVRSYQLDNLQAYPQMKPSPRRRGLLAELPDRDLANFFHI